MCVCVCVRDGDGDFSYIVPPLFGNKRLFLRVIYILHLVI